MTRRLWVQTLGVMQAAALFLFGIALGLQFGIVGTGNDLSASAPWITLYHAALWLGLWLAREVVSAPLERAA